MTPSIEEAIRSGAVRLVPVTMSDEMAAASRLARMNVIGGYDGPYPGPWEAALAAAPDYTADLVALIEERDRLKVERDALRDVLSGLSSYLGAGLGDDATTAEQFDRRIREGIEITYAPMVEAWRKEMAR